MDMWVQKSRAASGLLKAVSRAQFMAQVERFRLLAKSLQGIEVLGHELPVTSTRKEKSGVLGVKPVGLAAPWQAPTSPTGGGGSAREGSGDTRGEGGGGGGAGAAADWREFYFVLFEGVLFYNKDSKSVSPSGYIALKHASIFLSAEHLGQGEFVFKLVTPLRTVQCRTKHAVALSGTKTRIHTLSIHIN
jgi:hypothetical protein